MSHTGQTARTPDGHRLAIAEERHRFVKWAAIKHCEDVVSIKMRVQIKPSFYGLWAPFIISLDDDMRGVAYKLAQRFAADQDITITFTPSQPDRCMIRAYDVMAVCRARCRWVAMLVLLPRLYGQSVPRDVRWMLAQAVWKTRRDERWFDEQDICNKKLRV